MEKKPFEYAVDLLNAARGENLEEVDSVLAILRNVAPPAPDQVAQGKAFWVNLYNGLVIWQKLKDPKGLHTNFGRQSFFSRSVVTLGGEEWSLNDIEHGVLRGNPPQGILRKRQISKTSPKLRFVLKELDPRIHGALNCGAISCPPIAYYEPDLLEEQLDMAIFNLVFQSKFDPGKNELQVSKIFDWYSADFKNPPLLDWFDRFFENDDYRKARKAGKSLKISYMAYNWK